jgi:aspartyl-tRNA(Asn)/glutamyl-tRNA(Gln) amidotransferase subunit A
MQMVSASKGFGSTATPDGPGDQAGNELNRCLLRIRENNAAVNAIITEADRETLSDENIAKARATSPLYGMPVAVKDNIDTKGLRTTVGSQIMRSRVPDEDAPVVRMLRAAGAIIVGKTNLPEFCLGGTTKNAHFGDCANPWDSRRVPGGSSGGSAAAVAAEMCVAALGSDTGGSIRIPSALCGVTGLRPTLGRVSNRGVFPVSPTFDTVGPIAYSALDVGRLFSVLAQFDVDDPTSIEPPGNLLPLDSQPAIGTLRIGVPNDPFVLDVQPSVAAAIQDALSVFVDLGCRLVPVTLSGIEKALSDARLLIKADAARMNREHVQRSSSQIGAEVLAWLHAGADVGFEQYSDAVARRRAWRHSVSELFRRVDVIATPTVSMTAPDITQADHTVITEELTKLTSPWAHAGVPAITLPCRSPDGKLPVGLQLIAAWWNEALLIRLGTLFQATTDFHMRRPAFPVSAASR